MWGTEERRSYIEEIERENRREAQVRVLPLQEEN